MIYYVAGIVQLEIRRARQGDAGLYTVVATNEVGEASCECQVTVKEIKSEFNEFKIRNDKVVRKIAPNRNSNYKTIL